MTLRTDLRRIVPNNAIAAMIAAPIALMTAGIGSAFAADADAFANALIAAMSGTNGTTATFDNATNSGGDIRIEGLTIVPPNDDNKIRFSSLFAVNVDENGNGEFSADRLEFVGGTISGEASGTIGTLTASDVTVLSAATIAAGNLPQGLIYKSGEVAGISIQPEGKPGPITIARITMETKSVVDNVPQDSTGSIAQITIPASYMTGGAVSAKSLGYENVVLDARWDGARDPATSVLTLREIALVMRDGGAITISGVLGNVPATRVNEPQMAMAALSQLNIQSLSLRYDDDSLARRLIDSSAERQGIPAEQYVGQLSAALPFFLTAIRNPGFQAEVAEAVGSFLNDPTSLLIKLSPETPVSGAEIMGLVGTAPQTLPDRLKATIKAGQ